METNTRFFAPLSKATFRYEDVFVSGTGTDLAADLDFVDADFKAEQMIVRSGSNANKIWIHVSGPANEAIPDLADRCTGWRSVATGQMFGFTEAIIGVPILSNVKASGDSTFRFIHSKKMIEKLIEEGGIRDNLLRILSASYAQIIRNALLDRFV